MRLVDADALKEKFKARRWIVGRDSDPDCLLDDAPTVCCETCKHGIKGERIGDHEYISCAKPHVEMSNYHLKDWVCGDWKDKNAVDR